jgi:hypothetical protein
MGIQSKFCLRLSSQVTNLGRCLNSIMAGSDSEPESVVVKLNVDEAGSSNVAVRALDSQKLARDAIVLAQDVKRHKEWIELCGQLIKHQQQELSDFNEGFGGDFSSVFDSSLWNELERTNKALRAYKTLYSYDAPIEVDELNIVNLSYFFLGLSLSRSGTPELREATHQSVDKFLESSKFCLSDLNKSADIKLAARRQYESVFSELSNTCEQSL